VQAHCNEPGAWKKGSGHEDYWMCYVKLGKRVYKKISLTPNISKNSLSS